MSTSCGPVDPDSLPHKGPGRAEQRAILARTRGARYADELAKVAVTTSYPLSS